MPLNRFNPPIIWNDIKEKYIYVYAYKYSVDCGERMNVPTLYHYIVRVSMNVKHYGDKKIAFFLFRSIRNVWSKKTNIEITMKKLLNYAYDNLWTISLPKSAQFCSSMHNIIHKYINHCSWAIVRKLFLFVKSHYDASLLRPTVWHCCYLF